MDVCREKGVDAGTLAVPIMFNTQHHSAFLDLTVCIKNAPVIKHSVGFDTATRCSTPTTTITESIAESAPSPEFDSSGDGSPEGYESSDEVAAVVDNMTSTNLAIVGISHLLYPSSLHRARIHMTVG